MDLATLPERLRQAQWRDLAVDWGQRAEWQQLPAVAFPGDTVIVNVNVVELMPEAQAFSPFAVKRG